MKLIGLGTLLVAVTSHAAPAVRSYELAEDTIEGMTFPPDERAHTPDLWALLVQHEYLHARDGFAAAAAQPHADRPRMFRGYILASVLAGGAPDAIFNGLAPFQPSTGEQVGAALVLVSIYDSFGDFARARAARSWELTLPTTDARATGQLHRELAREAIAATDWAAFERGIEPAIDAAAKAGDQADTVAFLREAATVLRSVFDQNRDRAIGKLARTLYARYLALPGVGGIAETKQLAADLEAELADTPAPGVTVHRWLEKELVRTYIKYRFDELAACHQTALLEHPTLAGNVTLELVVDRAGHVGKTATREVSKGIEPTARCMADRARAWRFPASDYTTSIRAPLRLVVSP